MDKFENAGIDVDEADEWYSDDELRENYTCLIGEDVGLSTFIIELL